MTEGKPSVDLDGLERGRALSIRTVFGVRAGDVLRARRSFHNPGVLTKGDIVIVQSVGDDGNITFTNLFRPTLQCGLNPDRFDWMSRPVTTLVPDYAVRDLAREAEGMREALVQADLTIRSFPGADQSHVEFIRQALQPKDTSNGE
jgi:hypothetical protein